MKSIAQKKSIELWKFIGAFINLFHGFGRVLASLSNKNILLATPERQTKYKTAPEKEQYGIASIQGYWCLMPAKCADEFVQCPFSQQCWGLLNLQIPNHLQPFQIKEQIPFFMEIIILVSWGIWTTRNGFIFKHQPVTIETCTNSFKHEFPWLSIYRAKKYFSAIVEWLDSLV